MKRVQRRGTRSPLVRIEELVAQKQWAAAWEAIFPLLQEHRDNASLCLAAGKILRQLGRPLQALGYLKKAVTTTRESASLWIELGLVEELVGDSKAAESAYDCAARLGTSAATLVAIGIEFDRQGLPGRALASMKRAWQMAPDRPELAENIAKLALNLNEFQTTVDYSLKAIGLKPDAWQAFFHLAVALQQLQHFKEAVDAYHSLLIVNPNDSSVYQNLGALCMRLGLRTESIRSFKRAIELAPTSIAIEFDLLHQQLFMHDWDGLSQRAADLLLRFRASKEGVPPFSLFSIPGSTGQDLKLATTRRVAQSFGVAATSARGPEPSAASKERGGKIRLGYLSSDFKEHATAYLMVRLFELHDRNRFELYAYDSTGGPPSVMGDRVTKAFDVVRHIREVGDHLAAEMIRADEIDILIDLKGHTQDNRIGVLARRPAPVQVHHVGFPGTIGAPFIDYLIADKFVAPEERASDFTEQLAYLPGSYQPTDATRRIGPRPSRTDAGLPERGFVFCSFNQPFKITPEVFDIWCRLLSSVEGSVLWLMSWAPVAQENLLREAARRDVDKSRIIFAPVMHQEAHLGRFQNADLFLDTLPVNAHTTASDALWASVPVVTLPGETFVSRVAGSLLTALGLTELIAGSEQEYFDIARELATDAAKMTAIRQRLARARETSILFDSERYTRDLEGLYELMHQRYQAGLPPTMLELEGGGTSSCVMSVLPETTAEALAVSARS